MTENTPSEALKDQAPGLIIYARAIELWKEGYGE